MVLYQCYLVVSDEAIPIIRDWIAVGPSTPLLAQSLRLPVRVQHTSGKQGRAGAFGCSPSERNELFNLIVQLPPEVTGMVQFGDGKSDNEPDNPTFDEFLSARNLTRI